MIYEVITSPTFDRSIKLYKKKFPKIDDDINEIVKELEDRSRRIPLNLFRGGSTKGYTSTVGFSPH